MVPVARHLWVEVPALMLTVDPFPYQDEAIDKALDRGNLLIAYGMGLGKTLVQLAICEELLGEDEVSLNALVVPPALKWQWAQAIVWATDVQPREIRLKKQKVIVPAEHQCVVIDGSPEQRKKQYEYARRVRPDYVILGYNNVVNDWRWVNRLKADLISLDEATAIKSFESERSKQIKSWWAPFRYALTGTPIDNRPEELFSVMEWVDPEVLGRFDLFDRAYVRRDGYGRPKAYKNLDVLHKKTKIFVARKTRFDPDVAPFMPKDWHREFRVDITGQTRTLYREIAKEMAERLSEIVGSGTWSVEAYYSGDKQDGGSQAQGEAMARFSALAMLCDHPWLLLESARKFEAYMESEADKPVLSGSKFAYELLMDGRLDWVNDKIISPKFEAVLEQIEDILDEREANKVIVFSFAKPILRYLRDRLPKGMAVIFDGDMNATEKEAAKQKFKTDPDVRVFLSSDAGGMGVDLPEANYLINYNHPWSAGKADQRNSRHIRAGSKWEEVGVLNYIVSGSVEEWKFSILELKRKVGSAILDGAPTNEGVIDFDVSSLLHWVDEATV